MSIETEPRTSKRPGRIPTALIVSKDPRTIETAKRALNGPRGIGLRIVSNAIEATDLLDKRNYEIIVFDDTVEMMNPVEFAFYVPDLTSDDAHTIAVGETLGTYENVLERCGVTLAQSLDELHRRLEILRKAILENVNKGDT